MDGLVLLIIIVLGLILIGVKNISRINSLVRGKATEEVDFFAGGNSNAAYNEAIDAEVNKLDAMNNVISGYQETRFNLEGAIVKATALHAKNRTGLEKATSEGNKEIGITCLRDIKKYEAEITDYNGKLAAIKNDIECYIAEIREQETVIENLKEEKHMSKSTLDVAKAVRMSKEKSAASKNLDAVHDALNHAKAELAADKAVKNDKSKLDTYLNNHSDDELGKEFESLMKGKNA